MAPAGIPGHNASRNRAHLLRRRAPAPGVHVASSIGEGLLPTVLLEQVLRRRRWRRRSEPGKAQKADRYDDDDPAPRCRPDPI